MCPINVRPFKYDAGELMNNNASYAKYYILRVKSKSA